LRFQLPRSARKASLRYCAGEAAGPATVAWKRIAIGALCAVKVRTLGSVCAQ
jgi:hypothetical protein